MNGERWSACGGAFAVAGVLLAMGLGGPAGRAAGQNVLGGPAQAGVSEDAALVVEGVVREVFRSDRRDRVDHLVEIEVRRADLGPARARVIVPAPGEHVYVHIEQPARGASAALPVERSAVRASLALRPQGGWRGVGDRWFQATDETLVAAGPNDPPPPAEAEAPAPTTRPAPEPSATALATLGLTVEERTINGRLALRVRGVERNAPGGRAGLEVGDVIVGVDGQPLEGVDQLESLARRGGQIELVVVDINSGRGARVPVDLATADTPRGERPSAPATTTPAPTTRPSPNAPADAPVRRSLGMLAEPVRVGARTAMKVVRVEPGGPAARAGLEPDDVIVAANGAPVTGSEQLAAAVRKSGPVVELVVRDSRTGRDVPIQVNLGGDDAPAPADLPIDVPTRPSTPANAGSGGRLGAVTELVFLDTEAAVKVTEVEPDSPAARAGLEPGDVIVAVGDTPVLHPNDLAEAIRGAGATATLSVIDPRTNRKVPVEVRLGGGR